MSPRRSIRKRKQPSYYNPDTIETNKSTKKLNIPTQHIHIHTETSDIPHRRSNGELVFFDYPHFRPNMTPAEVIQSGSFGGTYFRPIYSNITKNYYHSEAWKELPSDWLEGLDIDTVVASPTYDININTYGVKCGQGLEEWENSGWITSVDPYGWFQWYCRFYQGRRCDDDERQIQRGMGVMGPRGRWKRFIVNKCNASGLPPEEALVDYSISPKVRQLLQHWAYKITLSDLK
mmetsp:Transcript_12055/g.18209  ORF Transcript_12055/g.18209 Transcript_12055/m.18209 type:complete len:233 (+) Transcript_12055:151-849(+)